MQYGLSRNNLSIPHRVSKSKPRKRRQTIKNTQVLGRLPCIKSLCSSGSLILRSSFRNVHPEFHSSTPHRSIVTGRYAGTCEVESCLKPLNGKAVTILNCGFILVFLNWLSFITFLAGNFSPARTSSTHATSHGIWTANTPGDTGTSTVMSAVRLDNAANAGRITADGLLSSV